jgi:S-formylglutathione hydrolase
MTTEIAVRATHKWAGGSLSFCEHQSSSCQTAMRFSVYVPAGEGPFAVLYWLSGLTCSEENFMSKSGVAPFANEHRMVIVAPDTSPRNCPVNGDQDSWDFGVGAGFYVNATEPGWSEHYQMYDYVSEELPELINRNFPVNSERMAISGHSMGGHGAMVIGTRNPDRYRSVSAFAPISHPIEVPWGQKAFNGYLGADPVHWQPYDTVQLLNAGHKPRALLVDFGQADQFLAEQLSSIELQNACQTQNVTGEIRMQPGYDHGYYFVSTFLPDHLKFHGKYLS